MRWPREAITGLVATGVVLGMSVPMSFAATTSSITWSKRNIQFTTYTANNVSGYVENGTTYMPVWYVLQALKKSGYVVSFNGTVLDITPPGNTSANTEDLTVGTGNLAISFNGQVVKQVNSEVRIDPASGKSTQYIPIYYIQQILSALSFYNAWNGTTWTGRPVTVTMQGPSAVSEGQMTAFALGLQNSDGSFFFPNDPVTWSVTGDGQAQIDKNTGIFSSNVPGTYDVTASVDGFHWTQSVQVYGQAVGVALSGSNTSLVADGITTSTITVKAVDASGQIVPNFTGVVQLSIPAAGGTFIGGITSSSGMNTVPVYLYNGTGTVTLTSPTAAPTTGESITASDMTSVSQTVTPDFHYGSLVMLYSAPVVSQIAITPSTTVLNSSTGNSANLTFSLNDAAGNPVSSSYSGINATLTITGPGSFASGTSVTSTSVYLYPGSTNVSVPVYAVAGQSGPITITTSGDGVSGSTTLNANSTQSGPELSVTSQQGTLSSAITTGSTTLPAGTPFTLYTVAVTDGNGSPLPQADNLSISDSTTAASTTGTPSSTDGLGYFSVAGNQPYQPLWLAGTNTYSLTTASATGKAQFIVFNTGNAPATTSITIRDLTTNASTTTVVGQN